MRSITIHEFDTLVPHLAGRGGVEIPTAVFSWLEQESLKAQEQRSGQWVRLVQRVGVRAVQVTNYVGVIRAPNGFHIEVLPKIGKVNASQEEDRKILIEMLRCLYGFRHIHSANAQLLSTTMPLLDIFIAEFLRAVSQVIKHGLRNDYVAKQDHLFALRGKLLVSQHLRLNQHRADRFFTEHDEFSPNRPENRLLHVALRKVLSWSLSPDNQRLALQQSFVFADIPQSTQITQDFQRIRIDRGMQFYADALAWAKLILSEQSPLTGLGAHNAPSLLFPMEAVFEAYVAHHVARQLQRPYILKTQIQSQHLVRHVLKDKEQKWFRLKPDMTIRENSTDKIVLDTKWKLLDSKRANGSDKYGLSQSDFYQLFAYGQNYLNGEGDIVLIYPKTDAFEQPLPMFTFPNSPNLRLWVLPFCLQTKRLAMPVGTVIEELFSISSKSLN
jgi:5-methylcytosine-specific restriction enzyme subunit McrC